LRLRDLALSRSRGLYTSRRAVKNSRRSAALASAITPPFTSGRWLSFGWRSRSPTDPAMPALSS